MASFWGLDLEALWKGGYSGSFVGNYLPKVMRIARAVPGFPLNQAQKAQFIEVPVL